MAFWNLSTISVGPLEPVLDSGGGHDSSAASSIILSSRVNLLSSWNGLERFTPTRYDLVSPTNLEYQREYLWSFPLFPLFSSFSGVRSQLFRLNGVRSQLRGAGFYLVPALKITKRRRTIQRVTIGNPRGKPIVFRWISSHRRCRNSAFIEHIIASRYLV